MDSKFKYFQNEIINYLSEQENKLLNGNKIAKAFDDAETILMQKGGRGYPIGTIRTWKGQRYIKAPNGKWKPKYDGNSKQAINAIKILKAKASKCTTSEQLLELVKNNKERFTVKTAKGKETIAPIVKELIAHVNTVHNQLIVKDRDLKRPKIDLKAEAEKYLQNPNLSKEDRDYFTAIRDGNTDLLQSMVENKAKENGFNDAIKQDLSGYKVREGRPPKKTMTVYKTFYVDTQGRPSALFVDNSENLPMNVWIDGVEAYHFTDPRNGLQYVPSTRNSNNKNANKTGDSHEFDEKTKFELVKKGYITDRAHSITALAYRPGWHAGVLPFFPQGGKQGNKKYDDKGNIKSSYNPDKPETNYENIHRWNQVVFECEIDCDNDYTEQAQEELKFRESLEMKNAHADLQQMPEHGFYYYSTNPRADEMTGQKDAWVITHSMKIKRALSEDECNEILAKNGLPPQEWQSMENEDEIGKMDLEKLGYKGATFDNQRKTLTPITYDDDGKIIPLSERFNKESDDIRKSIKGETMLKSGNDPKFKHFQKLIIEQLNKLEGSEETKDDKEIAKAFGEADVILMQKGKSYPVGTIREWKGKKYIKTAPGKWRPKYDTHSRGAKMAVASIKRKALQCTNSKQLLDLVLENKSRFSDENGRPLPFIQELSEYISGLNDKLESGDNKEKETPQPKETPKEEEKTDNSDPEKDKFKKMFEKLDDNEKKKRLEIASKRGGKRAEWAKEMLSEMEGGKEETKETPKEESTIKDENEELTREELKKKINKDRIDLFTSLKEKAIAGAKRAINLIKTKGYELSEKWNNNNKNIRIYTQSNNDRTADTIKKIVFKKDFYDKELLGENNGSARDIFVKEGIEDYIAWKLSGAIQQKPEMVTIVDNFDVLDKVDLPEEPKEQPKEEPKEKTYTDEDYDDLKNRSMDELKDMFRYAHGRYFGKNPLTDKVYSEIRRREREAEERQFNAKKEKYPELQFKTLKDNYGNNYYEAKDNDGYIYTIRKSISKWYVTIDKEENGERQQQYMYDVSSLKEGKEKLNEWYINAQPNLTEEELEETEAEKHQNRSQAMMGNQNAKKDGVTEEEKKERIKKVEDKKTFIRDYLKELETRTDWKYAGRETIKRLGDKKLETWANQKYETLDEYTDKLANRIVDLENERGEPLQDLSIQNAIFDFKARMYATEMAREKLDQLHKEFKATKEDIPVDPKDMAEAKKIIGRDVEIIGNGGDIYNNKRQTLVDKIRRRVRNEPALARAMLKYIQNYQEETGNTVLTPRNSIWNYLPQLNENAKQAIAEDRDETDKTNSDTNLYESEDGDITVKETKNWNNKGSGRYEISFPGKPDADTRNTLKKWGFRWAPSTGTWVGFNTANGEFNLKQVAKELGLKQPTEPVQATETENDNITQETPNEATETVTETPEEEPKETPQKPIDPRDVTKNAVGTTGEKAPMGTARVEGDNVVISASKELMKEFKQLTKNIGGENRAKNLRQIGVVNGYLYATDGRRLKRIKLDGLNDLNGKTYQFEINGKDIVLKEDNNYGTFPNVERVVPQNNNNSFTLNNSEVENIVKELKKEKYFNKENMFFPITVENGDVKFFNNIIGKADKNIKLKTMVDYRFVNDILNPNDKETLVSFNDDTIDDNHYINNRALSTSTNGSDNIIMPMFYNDTVKLKNPDDYMKDKKGKDNEKETFFNENVEHEINRTGFNNERLVPEDIANNFMDFYKNSGLSLKQKDKFYNLLVKEAPKLKLFEILKKYNLKPVFGSHVTKDENGKEKSHVKHYGFTVNEDFQKRNAQRGGNLKVGEIAPISTSIDTPEMAKFVKYLDNKGYFDNEAKKSLNEMYTPMLPGMNMLLKSCSYNKGDKITFRKGDEILKGIIADKGDLGLTVDAINDDGEKTNTRYRVRYDEVNN